MDPGPGPGPSFRSCNRFLPDRLCRFRAIFSRLTDLSELMTATSMADTQQAPALVTGGCGFVGRHLIKKLLLDKKVSVWVIDNLVSPAFVSA